MLYKYRSLQNFKNLVDIFVNSRMYASAYADLNDPMEGYYLYGSSGELDPSMQSLIAGEKDKIKILSLSRRPDIALMWAHYADGNRGVAIGVEIDEGADLRPILYDGPPILPKDFNVDSAVELFTKKHPAWEYEEEERVFVRKGNFASLSVREVILGSRMSTQDKGLMKNLIGLLNPNIEIISQKG